MRRRAYEIWANEGRPEGDVPTRERSHDRAAEQTEPEGRTAYQ
ncbi:MULTISPECIES: DUF2934 domain-containing protein [Sinorhizobium/Ensifer group]|nr:DUF2934 domain-containing protein [Ensifer sp. ENS01]MBD9524042.1 DUF2934 domain-containing protein [Ensifer sp. ENS02]MBD9542871.1 DUF2934 domain-containing protein [Ensifer sp. ENS04]MBD9569758.1 DUF2934 domain-containing protein [Ensifer sp. ENS08]MBD9596712.1 DUF2934 domain-containing protein [Ensifer sp. ENS05]MBD9626624.1 DUF2934 domain-containing protein [Ensifer sp. ENS06]OWZ89098.1 hypothetical protein B9J07_34895 [Sinorhizobium sp. LM21]QHG74990.1 DUF2934 domain-containing prote